MTGLPRGWALARLDQVTTPRGEKADPASLGDIPFLGMDHIEAETAKLLGSQPVSELKSAVALFQSGDLLYGRLRPYLNKVHVAQFDGAASAEFIVFPPQPAIEQRFLQSILRSPAYRAVADQRSTGDRPRVKFDNVGDYEIPLPPLPEQRRIVRKLDTLTARTTTARTHLTAIEKLVERYKSGVLLAAFRGQLTSDLREPTNDSIQVTITDPFTHTQIAPPSWTQHLFSEVCRIVGGSQPPKSTFVYAPQEGYIRLVQIRDYKSDAKATYIPSDLARRFCSPSDIMIGRYGPPIFQILRGIEGAYNVALMKAEPTEAVDQEFLYWYLHHPILFRYVEIDSKRTAGQDGVNKAHLERWPILLPPLEEQREIFRRIETAFSKIDRLAAEAAKALKLVGHLDQRILAKAFAGELVPQDPTDEPAETLLARIRAAREAAPKAKRRRRTSA